MFKVQFSFYGKTVFAPKSNLLLQNWQRNIKHARIFNTSEDAHKAIDKIRSICAA